MLTAPDFKEKTLALIFCTEGQKFSFQNDNLLVKDKDDRIVLQNTCHRLQALWFVGSGSITTGLLERSKKFGFPILNMNQSMKHIGLWNSQTEGNFLLRKKQYTLETFHIAKHIIKNKIDNQLENLNYFRSKSDGCKVAISLLKDYSQEVMTANDLAGLMGLEGIAAKVYFKEFYKDNNWKGRKPRVKSDPLNVILDIGYTFLFNIVENMLHLYGFDIYQGVCHTNFYNRKSLVCDIQEPFRCIVDKIIKRAIDLGQFKESDFEISKSQYVLKHEKSRSYTQWLLKSILEYRMDLFNYCQQYYRAFIREKSIDQYPIFKIKN